MFQIIVATLAFFGDFFKRYVIEASLRISSFVTIIAINSLFFLAFFAGLLSFAKIIIFVFNEINNFFEYINSLFLSSDDIFLNVLSVFSSLGFFKAFNDVFSVFSPILISVFVLIFSKLLWSVLFHIRNSVLAVIISIKE
ncbi:hypothetical protein A9M92_02555 [Campylobacter lari]|uniref:hypothetical protein n=1 Tax=Campylobacter TaxID=194 RepID=UPI00105924B9|nr:MULTISPECIES: hypothetical protein [Campylobacter]EAI4440754.1 hypothetical protein [Campylobacter lari]EAI8629071.1 hypothetical protein [Campylobacter lari]EAK0441698.1 hypothetical protein [Campylobacter lari]EAK9882893.1 hypothetical protein [Campylobacter lari]EAL5902919.1 hypothetical protein [Campylobacter lari]